MALALILSSFVAATRIGGAAQQYVLAAHHIEPVLAPTALFGRSPAKGAVGQPTDPAVFRRMLADIEADAVFGFVDLVITGHFSSAEQVRIAAETLERINAASLRRPVIVVDPIMGDNPKGLYVRPEVAEAVTSLLVPMADWITPNAWELGELAGGPVVTARDAVEAARRIGRPALVTSIAAGPGEIGLVYVDERDAVLFAHPRIAKAPNGTGDLVTACFGAALVQGLEPLAAAQRTAQAVAQTMQTVHALGSKDLPIVAMAAHLEAPSAVVRMERL